MACRFYVNGGGVATLPSAIVRLCHARRAPAGGTTANAWRLSFRFDEHQNRISDRAVQHAELSREQGADFAVCHRTWRGADLYRDADRDVRRVSNVVGALCRQAHRPAWSAHAYALRIGRSRRRARAAVPVSRDSGALRIRRVDRGFTRFLQRGGAESGWHPEYRRRRPYQELQ